MGRNSHSGGGTVSTWSRGKKTTRTVEYTVPASEPLGANWNQVEQALNAALREWELAYRSGNPEPPDDAVRFHVRDDEIVISFEVPS